MAAAVLIPLKKSSVQYNNHERTLIMLSEVDEQAPDYNKNLKAAIRRAVNAPVASCWLEPTAALPVEEEEAAELAAVAEPEADEDAELEVSAADELSAAEVAARASAVALRVPHCWFSSHTDWACASLGCAATHCP